MRRPAVFLAVILGVVLVVGTTFAEEKSQKDAERDLLISNLTALRNQELRVAVLQQLLNEETGKLLRMQAIFSDQYKLDPEKLRAGLYQYDEKTGKFVEKEGTAIPSVIDPGILGQ